MTEEIPKHPKSDYGFGSDYSERYNLVDDPEEYSQPRKFYNLSSSETGIAWLLGDSK